MRTIPLLLLLWVISFTVAKDFTVDADLTSAVGDTYPSLAEAVSALHQNHWLIDTKNTITLKASCLNVPQTFPGGWIAGNESESLLIQFDPGLTPSTVSQPSHCSQLPTVVISSSQNMDFGLMHNLTFVGLNIQYHGSDSYNLLYGVTNVLFSNFCFNNSEPDYPNPTDSMPSDYWEKFYVQYIENITMTNGVYLFDGLKQFWITESSQITMNLMVFYGLSTMHDVSDAAIEVSQSYYYEANVDIIQSRFSCDSEIMVMPMVLFTGWINKVNITGFEISNCNFNGAGTNSQSLMVISGAYSFTLDDYTLTNVTYGMSDNQAMFWLNGIQNMTISNIQINQLNIISDVARYCNVFDLEDSTNNYWYFPSKMYFINWTLTNFYFQTYNDAVNLYFDDSDSYSLLQIQNIHVSNGIFYWNTNFMNIGITATTGNTIYWYYDSMLLDNITFIDTTVSFSNLLKFSYDYTNSIKCDELFHVQMSNVKLENISFYEANFLNADGYLIAASNVNAHNITLSSSSKLFFSSTIVSTFFLTNSQFSNFTLSDLSGITISNITEARDWKLESCYDNDDTIFAETRPFIIYNTTFMDVNASRKSVLFSSTNPMVIIQSNTFSQITLDDSNLFEVGRYLYFLNTQSYMIQWWLPGGNSYYPYSWARDVQEVFVTVENSIFREHSDLQQIYGTTRTNIKTFEPNNAIFFLSIQDNLIDTLQSLENDNLIILKNFQIDFGTVFVKNNTFFSISSDVDVNIFEGISLERVLAIDNTLSEVSIPGYLFSMSTSYLETLVLDSNNLTNTQQIGKFLVVSEECGTILINRSVAVNDHSENPFISISCGVIDSQVELLNSRFESFTQTSTSRELETINFISITIKKKSSKEKSQISLKNNIFKGITVNGGEAFTADIFESSFIFIMAIDSILTLDNNTFDEISIISQGNVFTLAIPQIYFANTTFSNLKFLDLNGAFYMIFYNLSITNCSFESNTGLDSDGVGLMKFTNPTPKNPNTVLKVSITNCTFEKNIGSWGAILYTKNTPIELEIESTRFLNNYVNSSGGLLEFNGVSLTTVETTNCVFESTEGYLQDYPAVQVFSFQNPGQNVSLTIKDSLMTIGNEFAGTFVHVENQQPVNLTVTNFTLTAVVAAETTDALNQFSMIVADNVVATLENINVSNLSIRQVGLFILNCNMARNRSHIWNLKILNSSFTGLSLTQGLILINSNENLEIALDNLTVLVQNSEFRDIDWSSNVGGIITSTTSLIGKSESSEFAVTVSQCTFQNLKGSQGLIYHGVESKFNYVLWLDQSTFYSLEASERGALINPSSTLLPEISINHTLQSDIVTFQITNCSLADIIAHAGAVFSWESQTRGITVVLEDNNFENISVMLDGGIFAGRFEMSGADQVLFENTGNALTISLKNSSHKNISAQNGAIVCLAGATQLLDLTIESCTFELINSNQNGGVVSLLPTLPENSVS